MSMDESDKKYLAGGNILTLNWETNDFNELKMLSIEFFPWSSKITEFLQKMQPGIYTITYLIVAVINNSF